MRNSSCCSWAHLMRYRPVALKARCTGTTRAGGGDLLEPGRSVLTLHASALATSRRDSQTPCRSHPEDAPSRELLVGLRARLGRSQRLLVGLQQRFGRPQRLLVGLQQRFGRSQTLVVGLETTSCGLTKTFCRLPRTFCRPPRSVCKLPKGCCGSLQHRGEADVNRCVTYCNTMSYDETLPGISAFSVDRRGVLGCFDLFTT